jgi:hypothetical protein
MSRHTRCEALDAFCSPFAVRKARLQRSLNRKPTKTEERAEPEHSQPTTSSV